ncbi:CP2 transcription factor [Capsaspora owczarzaki ATCC 30864]|uniref:CP2 transcription factor n=1 Tax=Capsaspora owczarzaki (strain ATCC 30864) TaxID=595528 RepID=A0A0D2WQZ3_CAPO3|nr:CP2 transcription factor [Capsaspora owczarzaki ATCC 30864]KJE94220.1 CP2 transcription factor [Capsaspora owczarzaki ATCC 30864]|eukprot:XP_004347648.1 CP2 transcription factor [Capsaspora owczarzaki ATCC 30864]
MALRAPLHQPPTLSQHLGIMSDSVSTTASTPSVATRSGGLKVDSSKKNDLNPPQPSTAGSLVKGKSANAMTTTTTAPVPAPLVLSADTDMPEGFDMLQSTPLATLSATTMASLLQENADTPNSMGLGTFFGMDDASQQSQLQEQLQLQRQQLMQMRPGSGIDDLDLHVDFGPGNSFSGQAFADIRRPSSVASFQSNPASLHHGSVHGIPPSSNDLLYDMSNLPSHNYPVLPTEPSQSVFISNMLRMMLARPTTTNPHSTQKYSFILDAPTSIAQKLEEGTLTYVNKGQAYAVTFEGMRGRRGSAGELPHTVKSIIHLVFHDEHDQKNERGLWEYWRWQQPPTLRAMEVDRKTCSGLTDINELAFNAFEFKWNPREGGKIVVRVNCLSTEFSTQKGVKGMPLRIQIDTYENVTEPYETSMPVSRDYCQIKVFRDKGSERKSKDEAKSAEKKLLKILKQHELKYGERASEYPVDFPFCPPFNATLLVPSSKLWPKPALLPSKPQAPGGSTESGGTNTAGGTGSLSTSSGAGSSGTLTAAHTGAPRTAHPSNASSSSHDVSNFLQPHSMVSPSSTPTSAPTSPGGNVLSGVHTGLTSKKRSASSASLVDHAAESHTVTSLLPVMDNGIEFMVPRTKIVRVVSKKKEPVLTLYLRQEAERYFHSVYLDALTADDLRDKLADLLKLPAASVREILRRTAKGVLVQMDTKCVEHLENEDDFIVAVELQTDGWYRIVLRSGST